MTCLARRKAAKLIQREMRCKVFVVMVDGKENLNEQWNNDEHYPGAITDLCDRKNAHYNGGTERSKSVAEHFEKPALFITQVMCVLRCCICGVEVSCTPPAARHACLCECKG